MSVSLTENSHSAPAEGQKGYNQQQVKESRDSRQRKHLKHVCEAQNPNSAS